MLTRYTQHAYDLPMTSSPHRISITDVRLGDVIIQALGYRTVVDSIVTRANDSIMPHVLINGIATYSLRSMVEVVR